MYRLHRGLIGLGHQSRVLVSRQATMEPEIDLIRHQVRPFRAWRDKIADRMSSTMQKWWGLDTWSHRDSWILPQSSFFKEADVIHFHNLNGDYFNFRALADLSRRKPMVWT